VFASSLTYITQIAPPGRRTEAIGSLGAAGFLGLFAGPWLGDWILGAGERGREDFVALFLTAACAMVLPIVLLAFLRPLHPDHRSGPTRLVDFIRTARAHWPGTILLVQLAFGISMAVPFGFLAEFVDRTRAPNSSDVGVGIYFLGYGGWGLIVRLSLRRVPDIIGRRKSLIAGFATHAIGILSFLWIDAADPWQLIVPGLIGGTGHAFTFQTMMSIALERFPRHFSGTGSALSLMMVDLGFVGGAPVLGLIARHAGFHALFATVGSISLTATAIFTASSVPIWVARARQRRVDRSSGAAPAAKSSGVPRLPAAGSRERC